MTSLAAHLLIAAPQLGDPNFHRTVVLIMRHTPEGAFGVVLNRPTNRTIRDVWAQLGAPPCEANDCLHLGGPVVGPLLALHRSAELGEISVLPDIYCSTEKSHLETLIENDVQPRRLFVGYAGWGEGQLESELATGSWLTMAAEPEHLFDPPDDLWRAVSRAIGERRFLSKLNLKHIPPDVSLN